MNPSSIGSGYQSLLRGAFARAALLVAPCVAIAAAVGVAPPDASVYLIAGGAMALLASAVALAVHGRFLRTRSQSATGADAALVATRLQALLGASLAVKLAVVVVAVFALQRFGTKFDCTATFAVTFAAASILGQLAAAVHVGNRLTAGRTKAPVESAGRSRQQ